MLPAITSSPLPLCLSTLYSFSFLSFSSLSLSVSVYPDTSFSFPFQTSGISILFLFFPSPFSLPPFRLVLSISFSFLLPPFLSFSTSLLTSPLFHCLSSLLASVSSPLPPSFCIFTSSAPPVPPQPLGVIRSLGGGRSVRGAGGLGDVGNSER